MGKLIKLLVCVVGLAAFAWWGLTVPLGDRTLFEHVSRIGRSKESQDLVRGTKQKVTDLRHRIVSGAEAREGQPPPQHGKKETPEAHASATGPAAHAPQAPQDRLTSEDRRGMRRLLESARAKASAPAPN